MDLNPRPWLTSMTNVQQVNHPLFIIGNKRSGTSQLVRVLNLHPRIFVSHESDIAWILYQFHHNIPYHAHQWDSDRGMRVTLNLAGQLLDRSASPAENFLKVQLVLMNQGTEWLPAQQKSNLLWIGDKKPMQHTDPLVLEFILKHFPDARFLHIVRHPFEVAVSSDRFNETANGDFWLNLSTEEKVERWTFHEELAWKLGEKMPNHVHRLRYEDLCRDTKAVMTGVFNFLKLEPDAKALDEAARQTKPKHRDILPLRYSEATFQMASRYGYDLNQPQGHIPRIVQNLRSKIFKRDAR